MKARFEKFINKTPGGCWEWIGCKHERGYGYFYTPQEYSKRKMDYAHRVSLFLYKGERDDTLCVMHSCDNTSCVNPDHLSYGTHCDNMVDMTSKGRNKPGTQKLTDLDYELAQFMREEGVMVKDIAKYFNIDRGHASRISRGLTT